MNEQPFGKPVQLGHLLQNLVRRKGFAETTSGRELDAMWKNMAGERVAAKSYVRRLRGGVLEVGVSNGAILEELTCYLQHELLPAIQRKHPEHKIHSFRFIKVR